MTIKLGATLREEQERLSQDFIPAVLYGKGITNQILKIKKNDFDRVFKEAGESNLIDLDYGSGPVKVLIKDIQRDVIKNYIIHADLYQVNMKEKITAEVPLHFIGEAPAVKNLGGILMKDLDSLEVECLPSDLVDHIEVDVSGLSAFDDAIRINDLKLPKGISLTRETNEIVAVISQPRAVVETETAPAAEDTSEEAEEGSKATTEEGQSQEGKKAATDDQKKEEVKTDN